MVIAVTCANEVEELLDDEGDITRVECESVPVGTALVIGCEPGGDEGE